MDIELETQNCIRTLESLDAYAKILPAFNSPDTEQVRTFLSTFVTSALKECKRLLAGRPRSREILKVKELFSQIQRCLQIHATVLPVADLTAPSSRSYADGTLEAERQQFLEKRHLIFSTVIHAVETSDDVAFNDAVSQAISSLNFTHTLHGGVFADEDAMADHVIEEVPSDVFAGAGAGAGAGVGAAITGSGIADAAARAKVLAKRMGAPLWAKSLTAEKQAIVFSNAEFLPNVAGFTQHPPSSNDIASRDSATARLHYKQICLLKHDHDLITDKDDESKAKRRSLEYAIDEQVRALYRGGLGRELAQSRVKVKLDGNYCQPNVVVPGVDLVGYFPKSLIALPGTVAMLSPKTDDKDSDFEVGRLHQYITSVLDPDGLFTLELVAVNMVFVNDRSELYAAQGPGMSRHLCCTFFDPGACLTKAGHLGKEEILRNMIDLVSGLALLHDHEIYHQNLTESSLYRDLGDDGTWRMAFFSETSHLSTIMSMITGSAGSAGMRDDPKYAPVLPMDAVLLALVFGSSLDNDPNPLFWHDHLKRQRVVDLGVSGPLLESWIRAVQSLAYYGAKHYFLRRYDSACLGIVFEKLLTAVAEAETSAGARDDERVASALRIAKSMSTELIDQRLDAHAAKAQLQEMAIRYRI